MITCKPCEGHCKTCISSEICITCFEGENREGDHCTCIYGYYDAGVPTC